MEGLLDGIVVLDLGRVLACPYAATMMADMGATVIKIENPKGGDDTRKMGPFVNGNSVYYANFNRGKVGVTLNLKEPEGKEIFKEMVKKADVVLENYRPGTMEKLGLGYDVLKEVNPGIIYGSISGFGHTGPLSKRAGYDIVGQAMGGLMSTTGWPDGPATRTGTPMGDVLGALNMTVGVLAALVNKQRTGKGEKVDVALVDSVAAAILIGFSNCSGRVISMIGIAEAIKAFVTTHISSTFGFLIFANILFLICGMLIDINAAILLIVPLLLPTAVAMGVDTIHFGAIILVNLSVGFITPPFCSSVFMAQKLSGARYVDIIKEVMPFVVASLIVVILTTYCPALSTFIPNMVAGAAA